MSQKQSAVVIGGAPGEWAHCTGCGEGLKIGDKQPIDVALGAMKGFEKSHKSCTPGAFKEPDWTGLEAWVGTRDTGTSSLTLWAAAMFRTSPHGRYDVPKDPSDFGRCYRLVKAFPEVRDHFSKAVRLCPKWAPFVREWDALCALWEEESPTGNCPKLYDFIHELEKESAS